MAGNKTGLHKDISAILNNVQVRKESDGCRLCISDMQDQIGCVSQYPQVAAPQIRPIQESKPISTSWRKAIGLKQLRFADVIKVLKRVVRNDSTSRAEQEEQRLNSIRKHLLNNL